MELEGLVSQLAEFVSDGIFIADARPSDAFFPEIVWCNDAACEQFGSSRSELIGESLEVVLGRSNGTEVLAAMRDQLPKHIPICKKIQNYRRDGTPYWVNLSLRPAPDQEVPYRFWIGIQHDITVFEDMRQNLDSTRQELHLTEKRLWDAIEALPDAFVMYDKDNRLVACNTKYKEFYAASAPAIFPGATFEDIMRFGLQNGQYPEAAGREEEWLSERLDRANRASKPFERKLPGERYIVIHDVETDNGDIVGLRTDVTELRRKKVELEKLSAALARAKDVAETESRTDPLTGVGNRRGLNLYMDKIAERSAVGPEIALIHVDLDRFKIINDVYGHSAGDHVLCVVADVLRDNTRSDDFVAQVGGDEFVIVLSSQEAQNAAERTAKRIISACKETVFFGGIEMRFGASIGIAVAERANLSSLMESADVALYDAKASGRGRYVCYMGMMGQC